NDRANALALASSFDSRRAREIALDLSATLNRYAAIGTAFATAAMSAETSAALSESGGAALRNIAILNQKGVLQSELTGPPENILPLSKTTLDAARHGHGVVLGHDGKSFAIVFPAGGQIVAVELDAKALLPSASDEGALISTLSGTVLAQGDEWQGLPDAQSVALGDGLEDSRTVDFEEGSMLVALRRVEGWPLAAGAGSEVGDALGAWYGALPLYFFFIFGPAIAGAGLAVVFVREFERHARAAQSVKMLRATNPGERKLLVRLADAERRAGDTGRMQREFLANMSHELRTPLNAIIGFSEMIERGVFGHHGKYSEYARDIGSAGRDLHEKLGDILDFSDLKANLQELMSQPVDVIESLREILDETAEKARNSGLRFSLTFPTNAFAVGDPRAVRRILAKLVDNALQFSNAGGTIRLQVRNGAEFVAVNIGDRGTGFAPEELARVGQPFIRFERKGAETGTGMSLAVASLLALRMGGELKLDSQEGQGTSAELCLPKA
ncbi:MAG TPA: HAMP domain-containing sensor histidine kinase, partial [Rhizomicrobium sp.]|nr:HAMP domain-containing sensor histidine kinase [Rhizomicrobium sp.]